MSEQMLELIADAVRSTGYVTNSQKYEVAEKVLRAVAQWQPIETAPKDGTTVLLFCAEWQTAAGCWNARDKYWMSLLTGYEPTHWMPLPQAPKDSA